MKIRKNIFPRRLVDWICFLIIGLFTPIVFIFEMLVVLPACHEPYCFLYIFTFFMAVFLLFNIKSNMLACMMIDSSVDFKNLKIPDPADAISQRWRFCDECNQIAPPRSWHCKICKVCILRRDHHCLFTGCCIGYKNHRYFLLFIFYLFIGSTYAFVYNSIYLWVLNAHIFWNWLSIMKMACPFLLILTGSTWHNMYLVFYSLNILAFLYSVVLVMYHFPIVLRGAVSAERGQNSFYDQGWRANLRLVFGERMHLVWLCPFVKSKLLHNGMEWNYIQKDSINSKNKAS